MAPKESEEATGLLRWVEDLLGEPEPDPEALVGALQRLHQAYTDQQHRLSRLVAISDIYQRMLQEENLVMRRENRKKHRRETKLSRISDIYQNFMREDQDALSEAATRDPLTGLSNRRLIDQRLNAEWQRARRAGSVFTVAMIDLDHFKTINDRYGHKVGDSVLFTVGQAMAETLREHDLCGRWGGEEFLVLLTETGFDEALDIVERLRAAIAGLQISDCPEGVTTSAGVAVHHREEEPAHTIDRADRALYRAKQSGRNCIITE